MKELVELFREAEKKELRKELEIMTKLWKWIVGLNDQGIIRLLFGEELFEDTFGIFECTLGS